MYLKSVEHGQSLKTKKSENKFQMLRPANGETMEFILVYL